MRISDHLRRREYRCRIVRAGSIARNAFRKSGDNDRAEKDERDSVQWHDLLQGRIVNHGRYGETCYPGSERRSRWHLRPGSVNSAEGKVSLARGSGHGGGQQIDNQ